MWSTDTKLDFGFRCSYWYSVS